jgi:hypothetical protein
MATLSDAANLESIRRAASQIKLLLAIAAFSCIAQPASAASRSDTTAAEAITSYKGGDRDLMVHFLEWAKGCVGQQLFAIHKGEAALLPPAGVDEFQALAGFVALAPSEGECTFAFSVRCLPMPVGGAFINARCAELA